MNLAHQQTKLKGNLKPVTSCCILKNIVRKKGKRHRHRHRETDTDRETERQTQRDRHRHRDWRNICKKEKLLQMAYFFQNMKKIH